MKKMTERYDMGIFLPDEMEVRRALQKVCDKCEIYPFQIRNSKNKGFVVSFIRDPKIPQYKFADMMMNWVNSMKMELSLTTIIMQKRQGSVDTDELPQEIKQISSDIETKSSNSDEALLKKLDEDMDYFNSFTGKQILEADYDTREGRAADRAALQHKRNASRYHLMSSDATEHKLYVEGQLAFDLNKYL